MKDASSSYRRTKPCSPAPRFPDLLQPTPFRPMPNFSPRRPTVSLIDLDALRRNFRQIRAKVGPAVKVLSMVKANAYGHGAPEVARTLADEGTDAFGVATLEEGLELRQAGIRLPVLVVAGFYPGDLDRFIESKLTPVAHDPESLAHLEAGASKRGARLKIHL